MLKTVSGLREGTEGRKGGEFRWISNIGLKLRIEVWKEETES
jgi:hypothetical protein